MESVQVRHHSLNFPYHFVPIVSTKVASVRWASILLLATTSRDNGLIASLIVPLGRTIEVLKTTGSSSREGPLFVLTAAVEVGVAAVSVARTVICDSKRVHGDLKNMLRREACFVVLGRC